MKSEVSTQMTKTKKIARTGILLKHHQWMQARQANTKTSTKQILF
jgi:hypothetical protein